jgi:hypothetical protein
MPEFNLAPSYFDKGTVVCPGDNCIEESEGVVMNITEGSERIGQALGLLVRPQLHPLLRFHLDAYQRIVLSVTLLAYAMEHSS